LYVININKDTDRFIFSNKIYNHRTEIGKAMYHIGVGSRKKTTRFADELDESNNTNNDTGVDERDN